MTGISKMNSKDWKISWASHLDTYLNTTPRTGIFIKSNLKDIKSALELACGSSRDSIFLSKYNIKVMATDYEKETIIDLSKRFTKNNLVYQAVDGFRLPFKDKSFDLVFHNGFFVLFNENEKIELLLKEQARVSKKYIVIFVHNSGNKTLLERFNQNKKSDPIYNIRFFGKKELLKIVRNSGLNLKAVKMMRFGGYSDVFYQKAIKGVIPNIFYPFKDTLVPKLYRMQPWSITERIACMIELNQ